MYRAVLFCHVQACCAAYGVQAAYSGQSGNRGCPALINTLYRLRLIRSRDKRLATPLSAGGSPPEDDRRGMYRSSYLFRSREDEGLYIVFSRATCPGSMQETGIDLPIVEGRWKRDHVGGGGWKRRRLCPTGLVRSGLHTDGDGLAGAGSCTFTPLTSEAASWTSSSRICTT